MTMVNRPIIVTVVDEKRPDGAFKRSGKERTVLAMRVADQSGSGGAASSYDTILLLADDEGELVWVPIGSVKFVRIV